MPHRNTKPRCRSGFTLIIALMLMSVMFLVLISLSRLVTAESATALDSAMVKKARENAVFGMQIALAQIQRHTGPDQRVTAPATVHYPAKDELFGLYRNEAVNRGGFRTYLDGPGRERFEAELADWWADKNPRWTGVWSSERTGGVPSRGQLPIWLVSGNERFDVDPSDTSYPTGYLTPDSPLPDPANDIDVIWMVGEGSAVDASGSPDGLDGRVKAMRQPIGENTVTGHYAYWVGDESTKANFTLRDPFYDVSDPSSPEYRNRLLAPQRAGWERVSAFEAFFDGGSSPVGPNDERLELLATRAQVGLLDVDLASTNPQPHRVHFHDLTTFSENVLNDVARGGLKKDLTAFFELGEGLSETDPIPDPADYAGDVRFGISNAGFPLSLAGIPTWGDLRDWYLNEASGGGAGTINVEEGYGPIVTGFRLHFGFSREGSQIYMHLFPVIILWNPFDAALSSENYETELALEIGFRDFSVATDGLPDTDPTTDQDGEIIGTSSYLRHRLRSDFDGSEGLLHTFRPWEPDTRLRAQFSGSFGPGETKVFSVVSDQLLIHPDQAGGAATALSFQMEEGFDTDFPASIRFPIMDILPPVPADGDTTRFVGGADVSWDGATQNLVFTKNIRELVLSAGDYETRMVELGQFEPGIIEVSMISGENRSEFEDIRDNRPGDWRILFPWASTSPADDFKFNIVGSKDTHDPDSPLIGFARINFEPFTINPWTLEQVNQIGKFYRAFANYNLHADEVGLHPDVMRSREVNANLSPDRFPRLEYVLTNELEGANVNQGGIRWDQGLTDPAGTTNSGFSLITPFYESPNGRYLGIRELPLRLVKRPESELLSLGQLQQVNLAPYFWQPTFVIGNSEASPYVDRESIAGITSRQIITGDRNSSPNPVPNDVENRTIDLSFLLNEALWDAYFLSGVPQSGGGADAVVTGSEPLPNSRIRVRSDVRDGDEIRGFEEASRGLVHVGALNVNSTSVEAWRALLTAFRDLEISGPLGSTNPDGTVPVSRTLEPQKEVIDFTFDGAEPDDIGAIGSLRDYTQVMSGFRYLTDDMVTALAERIVDEVRLRGPFLSLSDFVNRRLVAPDRATGAWDTARTDAASPAFLAEFISNDYDPLEGLSGINGALQRAINLSGINGGVNYPAGISGGVANGDRVLNAYSFSLYEPAVENNSFFNLFPTTHYFLDTEHIAGAPAGEVGQFLSHSAGFVSQGDLLAMIGSALTAQGNTFLIRSYGDVVNPATGEVQSQVWLETVVQRRPEPVQDLDGDYEPDDSLGRRYEIVSMRWLTEDEI